MTHPNVALVAGAYQALNQRDLEGFMSAFADDAVLYGADDQVNGKEAISAVVNELIELSMDTLEIEIHDIVANDAHTVALQTTKARVSGRQLADRVVYVFHIGEEGLVREAYFNGDPRVQARFFKPT